MGRVLSKDKFFEVVGYQPHRGGLQGDPGVTSPHPYGGQAEIHFTPARFKVVRCGRRWGKTHLGGHEAEPNVFVPCPVTGKPQIGWIIGPNYTDAEKEFRIIYDTMRKLGVDRDAITFRNNVESGALVIRTAWGAEIHGKSAQHPETLVGEGLNWAMLVEAGRHKRKTWADYIRPALSDRRGWALMSGVPEGTSANSMLYSYYQRGQNANIAMWKSWKRPSWDNTIVFPKGRQDPEIVDAAEDLTKDEFDRQYGAEFRDRVGPVMKEWDDDIHLGDFTYDPSWDTAMAVDYGFTNDFVVLIIQEGPFGELRVIYERRWNQVDTEEVCIDLMQDIPGLVRACSTLYPDPAEPDDTRTMMRKLRIPARHNTGGLIKNRIRLIRKSLKERNTHLPEGHADRFPTLQVDRSCTKLAWEFREGYRWPEKKSEIRNDSENPLDKDNHGIEALGRFFKGRFGSVDKGQSQSHQARIR